MQQKSKIDEQEKLVQPITQQEQNLEGSFCTESKRQPQICFTIQCSTKKQHNGVLTICSSNGDQETEVQTEAQQELQSKKENVVLEKENETQMEGTAKPIQQEQESCGNDSQQEESSDGSYIIDIDSDFIPNSP
eukprot:TRINITY_DN9344_c0_g1_i2.p3 TRINITY_DN9344_c0_g1~~TRINITY_DN9344_c0_g1_i2.p3  ORF type:complete len:155 (+),score=13.60 TRINITY_DN9344_c0_g1_i2:64-465(+)